MNYRNLAICIATSLSLHALPAIATEDGNKPNANWPSWEDNQADSDSLILQGATILQAPPPPSSEPTGPLSGIGKYLKSNGIELGILFNDFFLYQYQTGRIPNSTMNSSDIKYHVGLDLEKIMGIPNTKLKFDLTQYLTSQNAFDFVVFSNSYFFPGAGGYDSTMLSRLSIESTFMDGRLTVELGRMNPIFDFMMPTFCGLCFNGTQARNAFFPGPDAQVWGGRAAYRLNPHDTVQVGLYENDLYVFQKTNGWYFSTDQAIGYIALANYVHETTFLDEEKPVKYELGMFYNSADYNDPLLNTDFTSHVLKPWGTALVHDEGVAGVFGQFRKVIWSEVGALGNPFAENVALYGALFVTPGAGVAYPVEAIGGIEISNFVPRQPFWMFGVGLHYVYIGDRQAQYEQQMRVALGGLNVSTPQNMFSPTITLRFPISDFTIGQAFAEYFINQDSSYIPTAERPKDGWFLGMRVTVDIGKALGLNSGGMFF